MLIVPRDADVTTPEHSVAICRLLCGSVMIDMGDMENPTGHGPRRAASGLAHRLIGQTDLLLAVMDPFYEGAASKGICE